MKILVESVVVVVEIITLGPELGGLNEKVICVVFLGRTRYT